MPVGNGLINPHSFSVDANREVQRSWDYELVIQGLDDEIHVALSKGIPFSIEVEKMTLNYGNTEVYYAGKATVGSGTISVYDFIKPDIEWRLYTQWWTKVYDPQKGALGWNYEYKRDGLQHKFGPGASKPYRRTTMIKGMMPTSFKSGDMAKDGSDLVQIEMDIQYDNAYLVR